MNLDFIAELIPNYFSEENLLHFLQDNFPTRFTAKDLYYTFDIPYAKMNYHLKKLVQSNRILRFGIPKAYHYTFNHPDFSQCPKCHQQNYIVSCCKQCAYCCTCKHT